jgi:hypothetical protein
MSYEWSGHDVPQWSSDDDFLDGEYPTELALHIIRVWPATDYKNLFAFIEEIWWMGAWGWHDISDTGLDHIHISTGGWSGNEEIIRAMRDNQMFWSLHWYQIRRGGHYQFEPPRQ